MILKNPVTQSYLYVIIKDGVFHMDASVRLAPLLEVYTLIALVLIFKRLRKNK